MNFSHLKYFVDAASAGGISAAARSNFVTQSAVSRAIAKLEDELGVELVLHKQNHFQLTEAGEAALTNIRPVLVAISQLKTVALDHSKTLSGPLRIGCNQAIASKLIGPMLPKLEAQYPNIKPDLQLGNTDQVQQMLERQKIDFGLVIDDGEVGKLFSTKPIYTGQFIVVQSPKTKIARVPANVIVSRTRKGGLSERYASEFERLYGQTFKPKLVVSSWQVILDLAINGYGCALVPQFMCEESVEAKKLLIVKHKVRPITFQLCAIVSKNRFFPKIAQAFFSCFPKR